MKKSNLYRTAIMFGFALTVLPVAACATDPEATDDQATDSSGDKADSASSTKATDDAYAAISQNLAIIEDGWNTFDADKIVGLTVPSVSFISPYGDRVDGRNTLRAFVTSAFVPNVTHAFELEHLRLIKPTVALTDELVTVTGYTDPNGNPIPPVVIHAATVWVKSSSKWLASDIRNHVYLPHP